MSKIIGFMGAAQSGKGSSSNLLNGVILQKYGKTDKFEIHMDGTLWIDVAIFAEDGQYLGNEMRQLEVESQSDEFVGWAKNTLWKLVKVYNFAWPLKQTCMNVFGLTHEQCYGADKNGLTDIKWGQFVKFVTKNVTKRLCVEKQVNESQLKQVNMTAREVMEYSAECIFRKIDPNIFVKRCLERIKLDNAPLAVLSDVRKSAECLAIQEEGGRVIRFTRNSGTALPSESTLMDCKPDLIIENHDISLEEKNQQVLEALTLWGYV